MPTVTHGHPFEVVIPCSSLEEANEEKADLHVAAEARAFIRPAGVTLTPAEAAAVVQMYRILTLGVGRSAMLPGTAALVDRLEREAGA